MSDQSQGQTPAPAALDPDALLGLAIGVIAEIISGKASIVIETKVTAENTGSSTTVRSIKVVRAQTPADGQ